MRDRGERDKREIFIYLVDFLIYFFVYIYFSFVYSHIN